MSPASEDCGKAGDTAETVASPAIAYTVRHGPAIESLDDHLTHLFEGTRVLTADTLQVSADTVMHDWRLTRVWPLKERRGNPRSESEEVASQCRQVLPAGCEAIRDRVRLVIK